MKTIQELKNWHQQKNLTSSGEEHENAINILEKCLLVKGNIYELELEGRHWKSIAEQGDLFEIIHPNVDFKVDDIIVFTKVNRYREPIGSQQSKPHVIKKITEYKQEDRVVVDFKGE